MLTKVLFGIEIVLGLIVIVSVLMQKSKADALSGLVQGRRMKELFFSKNKGRTKDALLAKVTMISMLLFAINTDDFKHSLIE